MKSLKMLLVIGMLGGLVLVSAAGCCNKEKEMVDSLSMTNEQLEADNRDLQSRLAMAEGANGPLRADNAEKDLQIQGHLATINELENRKPDKSDVGTSTGWQSGTFGDKTTLSSDILFSSGKADLTAKGKAAIDAILGDLKGRYDGLPIRIYGHTDTDPIRKTRHLWKDNLDLSANRAMAVTRHLVAAGISAKQIETIGMGSTIPAGTKDSSRRVEIYVIKSK